MTFIRRLQTDITTFRLPSTHPHVPVEDRKKPQTAFIEGQPAARQTWKEMQTRKNCRTPVLLRAFCERVGSILFVSYITQLPPHARLLAFVQKLASHGNGGKIGISTGFIHNMKCQQRNDLERANASLIRAAAELRSALKQPDEPISVSAIEQGLGHETDQVIRDIYHDLTLTMIRTSQELEHHALTCETCLREE